MRGRQPLLPQCGRSGLLSFKKEVDKTPCPNGIVRYQLNPQASSKARNLLRHGLTAGSVTTGKAWGENKTDSPTNSKWQIGLVLWLKVARHEPERSAASAKRAATSHRGIPKGAALGAPLVTFPATGKSPGCRAERLHQEAQELPAPQNPGRGTERPLIGECRGGLAPSQRSCYPGPRQWPKSKRRRERNPFPASPSRGFFLI